MLALYPPSDLAEAIAVPGGMDPAGMHVTVAYTGDAADTDPEALRTAAAILARRAPLDAVISGHARFTGGEHDVLIALVDSPQLEQLRRDSLDQLAVLGVHVPAEHGYTAHITLAYLDPGEPLPLDRITPAPVRFTAISAVHGTARDDHAFTPPGETAHPIAATARHAYAAGWAASGGPMTERVKAGALAAVQTACEHADDPHILEATLRLGHLEGMWATLYARRDNLISKNHATVLRAWRKLVKRRHAQQAVAAMRAAPIGEQAGDADRRKKELAAAAAAAAASVLADLPATPTWLTLRAALRDALADGNAEGQIEAVAMAAERVGKVGLDWDIAFTDAYKALGDLEALWADADGWLARMVGRAAADLGRALAAAAASGASYQDMLAAAMDALGVDDTEPDAVAFVVDWAMTTAADQGALRLYLTEGVAAVDVITAADNRVCPICDALEADNPHPVDDAPQLPAHPLCRCVLAADFDLGPYTAWFTI